MKAINSLWILIVFVSNIHVYSTKESHDNTILQKTELILEKMETADFFHNIEEDNIKQIINNLDSAYSDAKHLRANISSLLGKTLSIYAKSLLFGKNPKRIPNIRKAVYFFKLASEYGNAESLYYSAVLSFFKLDGQITIEKNYLKMKDEINIPFVEDYIFKRNSSNILSNLYIASMQNHSESIMVLGNLFLHGTIVKKNCKAASQYYKDLGELIFLREEFSTTYSPNMLIQKKLYREFYFPEDTNSAIEDEMFNDNPEEIEFIKMSADLGKVNDLLQMGYIYYYGLRGLKKDYEKAFEYFYRAANLGDTTAKTTIGYMYLSGIGSEKDYKKAHKYLAEAALKNDPRAKNGLGYLHQNGLGVSKSEKEALEYYYEAARENNYDAQYNYASLLSQQPDPDKKNVPTVFQYINSAAIGGHSLAMFHLGLMHLTGDMLYYSCDIGAKSLQAASLRGPWSEKLRLGYYSFIKKNMKGAFMHYLESILLGYDTGLVNTAILLDHFNVLEDEDFDFSKINHIIERDHIYLELIRSTNFKPTVPIYTLLFGDVMQAISLSKSDTSINILIEKLISPYKNIKSIYREEYLVILYETGVSREESFSLLRMGDFYAEGIILPQNYTKASEYYSRVVKTKIPLQSTDKFLYSLAYFNLGYYNHYGLGVQKNLTQAIKYYNLSIITFDKSSLYVRLHMNRARFEKYFSTEYQYLNESSFHHILLKIMEKIISPLLAIILFIAFCIISIYKIRLQNYISIYHTDHPH